MVLLPVPVRSTRCAYLFEHISKCTAIHVLQHHSHLTSAVQFSTAQHCSAPLAHYHLCYLCTMSPTAADAKGCLHVTSSMQRHILCNATTDLSKHCCRRLCTQLTSIGAPGPVYGASCTGPSYSRHKPRQLCWTPLLLYFSLSAHISTPGPCRALRRLPGMTAGLECPAHLTGS